MKEAAQAFWKCITLIFSIINDLLTPLAKEASDFRKEKEQAKIEKEDE